jgi:hypothetical protein
LLRGGSRRRGGAGLMVATTSPAPP